ncbi:hypothetical protein [Bordetella pertussis]|uniref:hypothetical protein n=1 Tax=Bordetella pertussis TaxID=520 RepID=UPI0003D3F57B|nr:hypothetical protein [Bordetella pertussis]ETH27839.1 hypothetical protein L565_0502 [Bordetella pertussis CHLA-20]ETH74146.1 hypothetical protein L555_0501 [Bordetella pertussis STO1-CHOC-0008]
MHGSSEPDLRSCTHLQTQPGRIQPIDSSQLAWRARRMRAGPRAYCFGKWK